MATSLPRAVYIVHHEVPLSMISESTRRCCSHAIHLYEPLMIGDALPAPESVVDRVSFVVVVEFRHRNAGKADVPRRERQSLALCVRI
jgi:hypothetical protein